MCDKAKHLTLTKRSDPVTHIFSGDIGGAEIGELELGGNDKWVLLTGDREVDVERLTEKVLQKWQTFFQKHDL